MFIRRCSSVLALLCIFTGIFDPRNAASTLKSVAAEEASISAAEAREAARLAVLEQVEIGPMEAREAARLAALNQVESGPVKAREEARLAALNKVESGPVEAREEARLAAMNQVERGQEEAREATRLAALGQVEKAVEVKEGVRQTSIQQFKREAREAAGSTSFSRVPKEADVAKETDEGFRENDPRQQSPKTSCPFPTLDEVGLKESKTSRFRGTKPPSRKTAMIDDDSTQQHLEGREGPFNYGSLHVSVVDDPMGIIKEVSENDMCKGLHSLSSPKAKREAFKFCRRAHVAWDRIPAHQRRKNKCETVLRAECRCQCRKGSAWRALTWRMQCGFLCISHNPEYPGPTPITFRYLSELAP